MLVLEKTNLDNFRKMFDYIPDKVFPSILLMIGSRDNSPILKFSDIDINQSLVINIEIPLVGIDPEDMEEETYRLPLTKNVKNIVNSFDQIILEDNSLKGISSKKEVQISMYINESDEYEFPKTADEMLIMAMDINQKSEDDVIESKFELTHDIIKDLNSCLEVLDRKDDNTILNMSLGKNAKSIIITAKDIIGNNFKYTIENVEVPTTFKVKYDSYFLYILKVLSYVKKIDTFNCTLSNLMFGTSFEHESVSVMLAATVFEKIK